MAVLYLYEKEKQEYLVVVVCRDEGDWVETGGRREHRVGTGGNHMFCTFCGSQLPGGALFCARCGNRVPGMQQPGGNGMQQQQPRISEFYHGTSVEAAMSIRATGFDVSRSGSNAGAMLGPGLYVTTTLQKALTYATMGHRPHGGAVLKLRVDLGNCYTVGQSDPNMKRWQQMGYDSAWSADGVNGKREEHCIKDPRPPRVQILDMIPVNTRKLSEGGFVVANGHIVQGGTTGQYLNPVSGSYQQQPQMQQQAAASPVPPSGLWICKTVSRNYGTGTEQHHYTFHDDGSITGEAYNIEWNRKTPHDPFWTVIRGRWDRGGTFQYSEVGHPSAASATGKFTDAGMKEAKVKGGSKVDSYTATITFARDLTAADRKAAQDAENHHKAVYNGRKECVIS